MATTISDVIPEKPTIHLDSKVLPEIKNWKVGKKYTVHLDVRLTGMHEEYGDKKVVGATFEVNKAEDCND